MIIQTGWQRVEEHYVIQDILHYLHERGMIVKWYFEPTGRIHLLGVRKDDI